MKFIMQLKVLAFFLLTMVMSLNLNAEQLNLSSTNKQLKKITENLSTKPSGNWVKINQGVAASMAEHSRQYIVSFEGCLMHFEQNDFLGEFPVLNKHNTLKYPANITFNEELHFAGTIILETNDDAQWGFGLKINNSVTIYFARKNIRDSQLAQFKQLTQICSQKTNMLNDFLFKMADDRATEIPFMCQHQAQRLLKGGIVQDFTHIKNFLEFKRKERLQEMMIDFSRDLNIYDDDSLDYLEDKMDTFALQFFKFLKRDQLLIKNLSLKNLADVVKLTMKKAPDMEGYSVMLDFFLENSDEYFTRILNESFRLNKYIIQNWRHFHKEKKGVSFEEFLRILKVENDIIYLLKLRESLVKYVLKPTDVLTVARRTAVKEVNRKYGEHEKSLQKLTNSLEASQRIRMSLLKMLMDKADPEKKWWGKFESLLDYSEENHKADNDFGEYGRWEEVGAGMKRIYKFQNKTMENWLLKTSPEEVQTALDAILNPLMTMEVTDHKSSEDAQFVFWEQGLKTIEMVPLERTAYEWMGYQATVKELEQAELEEQEVKKQKLEMAKLEALAARAAKEAKDTEDHVEKEEDAPSAELSE